MEEMARFQPSIAELEKADLVVLELAATYDAFREMGSDHVEAVARLKHKKAAKWTRIAIPAPLHGAVGEGGLVRGCIF